MGAHEVVVEVEVVEADMIEGGHKVAVGITIRVAADRLAPGPLDQVSLQAD